MDHPLTHRVIISCGIVWSVMIISSAFPLVGSMIWFLILSCANLCRVVGTVVGTCAAYALASYRLIGRGVLSVPALVTEVVATTLFIWMGYKALEIYGDIERKRHLSEGGSFWRATREVFLQRLKIALTGTAKNRSFRSVLHQVRSEYRRGCRAVANGGNTLLPNRPTGPLQTSINTALEEFICPITMQLPVDPVLTEGGDICERTAIKSLIRQSSNLKSLRTNKPMGPRLTGLVHVRNAIEELVRSGAVEEELATAWKQGREKMERQRQIDNQIVRFRSIGRGFL